MSALGANHLGGDSRNDRARRQGLARRLVIVVGALTACGLLGRAIDVRTLAGTHKGDEATYVAMATSLVSDGDLSYTRADYLRFRAFYGQGPEGIFLKRAYDRGLTAKTPVSSAERLAYGKAFIYPLVAAPFVALGGLGGMLVFNWLLVALCVWCGILFCQARAGRVAGVVMGASFVLASDVTVFAAWMAPEVFNFAVVVVAYFLWLYKKVAAPDRLGALAGRWTDVVAAVLIGIVTFSKPNHALLVVPIGLDALLAWQWPRFGALVIAFLVGSGGLYTANEFISGEWNYQGAAVEDDRRSFYGRFPFDDANTSFERTGRGMSTTDTGVGQADGPDMLGLLPVNSWYFLVGRHAGLVPYYFPGVVVLIAWLWRWRRSTMWQWATAGGFVASVLTFLVLTPDSWNGAGGPPGNRYIVSTYAVLLFLVPAGFGLTTGLVALAGGLAFIGHMVFHPFTASAATWLNVERAPLRWMPVELSLINDLPVRLEPRRGPVKFITEPIAVYFYYLDSHTYFAEGDGFWIAGDAAAEIIVKTEKPLARATLRFSSRVANDVTAAIDGRKVAVHVGAGGEGQVSISPGDGFVYAVANDQGVYGDTYVYILRMTTTAGFVPAETNPGATDTRNLGVFVRPTFVFK